MKLNWKAILIFLTAVALGTGIFLNFNQIITLIQEKASPLVNMIQPGIVGIQNVLGQIPSEWRGLLMGSIPVGLVGLAYTWWRNRANEKLAQQSMARIQELSTANLTSTTTVEQLRKQIAETPQTIDLSGTVQSLRSQMADMITDHDQERQRWQNEYNTMERTLQNEIIRIKQEPVTVVK